MMSEYIDDGDISFQYNVVNDKISTSYQYMEMLNNKVSEVVVDVLECFISGTIVPQKQDKSQASWVGKRNEKKHD